MFALFGGKKTPEELIISAEKHLQTVGSAAKDGDDFAHSVEKLTKHLHVIKLNLMGDGENEIDEEARRGTMEHLLRDQFFSTLIQHLEHLEFEAKKECTQIFNNVMRKGDAEGVFRANPRIVSQLVGFCSESGIALHCGNMLRELLRQEAIAEMVLMGNGGELFFQFFDFVELPNFDVASDAFDTFKILLTKHKALVTRFLTQSYEEFFSRYNSLMQFDNYVIKRQSIKLLGEVLLDRSNFDVMMRYIGEKANLKVLMMLLRDTSKSIQIEAFHVFKVFVANPNKTDEVVEILHANKDKLIHFLSNFKTEKDTEQFAEERSILLHTLQSMAPPASQVSPAPEAASAPPQ